MPTGTRRQRGQYAKAPLTYSTGTTPGEQEIDASTTAPTLVTDGFVLAGLDTSMGGSRQLAAPAMIDVLVELIDDGTDPADIVENFSLWFYFPDAGTANKWRETVPMTAAGVNKRGALGGDNGQIQGNVYKVDVPQGATRGFVHVPSLAAGVIFAVLVYPDN